MPNPIESGIIVKLDQILPLSALSYKQVLLDLAADERPSYRGTALELREIVREVLDHLAPDDEVLKTINLDKDQKKPTMQQKAAFILGTMSVGEKAKKTAEDAVRAIENSPASFLVRSVYNRASASVHGGSDRQEIDRLKNYTDAVLSDLLKIRTRQTGCEVLPLEIPGGLTQQLAIWPERQQWWAHIPSIIRSSSKIVVVESYFGNHHLFWHSLEERLKDKEQFEFVLVMLRKGSPALKNCLKTTGASMGVTRNDRARIQRLRKLLAESPCPQKKTLEYLTWDGYGPGSVVWWIADGKESIGLGCWLQCPGNTDTTPWIVLRQGLLFQYIKLHCENTIRLARAPAASQSPQDNDTL